MADTFLNQVRADLAIRKAECESLQAQYLEKLEVVESIERYVAILEGEIEQPQDEDALPERATLGEAIMFVLRHGEELHREEITDRLQKLNFHIGGQVAVESVGSRMASDRRKRFSKGSRKGYWRLTHPPLSAETEQAEGDGESDVIDMSNFQQTGSSEG